MAASTYSLVNVSGRFVVNQTTAANQYAQAVVVMGDGSFVTSYNDGAGFIRMTQRSASGTAIGNEILVSGGINGDISSEMTRLADGKLVVTWNDDVGFNDGIGQRLYSASLQPLTDINRVNPTGTAAFNGDVAALADGGYVVAYELQKTTTDHDIYAQRYDANGVAVGNAVAVETSTENSYDLSVTGLKDGGYAIAYSNQVPSSGINATRLFHTVLNADNSVRVAPTVLDAMNYGTFGHLPPNLTALADGEYLIAYNNDGRATVLTMDAQGAQGNTLTLDNFGGVGGAATNPASSSWISSSPSVAISSSGYMALTYATNRPQNNRDVTIDLLSPGASAPTTSAVPDGDWEFDPTVAWLDESHIVQVYASYSNLNSTLQGGDGSDYGITASIYQVERNTTATATSETIWLDGLADRVTMGDGDDGVFAGDGNNTVRLGAGNDVAVGGSGPDALLGGAGVDWLYGMAGADYLYGGTETDALMGGDGNDFLFGEDGDDYGFGDAGDDAISGAAGVDRLYGGAGNDTLDGGSETDALYGEDGNDLLFGGTGDDYLFGGLADDILIGGAGNDLLSGDAGNDTLKGEAGNDWLIGGTGFTVFQFEGMDTGIDTIADYKPNIDSLVLIGTARTSAADVKANLVQVGNDAALMTSATSGMIFLNTQVSQINERFILVA